MTLSPGYRQMVDVGPGFFPAASAATAKGAAKPPPARRPDPSKATTELSLAATVGGGHRVWPGFGRIVAL
jgi:hypothetical protein